MPTIRLPIHLTFQPTLPARGATAWRQTAGRFVGDFNPRSPHGERPAQTVEQPRFIDVISTHAPRTGSDFAAVARDGKITSFQPTLPARGATAFAIGELIQHGISTHAPRTGSDHQPGNRQPRRYDFNPRSPHGERRRLNLRPLPPLRISTHAPRTGSDVVVRHDL